MQNAAQDPVSPTAAFGTAFTEQMTRTEWVNGQWTPVEAVPVAPLQLHPAAHVLHYSSTCFEGLKAFRLGNGDTRIFRLDQHLARFRQSAELLCLPIPEPEMLEKMIRQVVELGHDDVPEAPGALYLRPTLMGTEANIGAAGAASNSALCYVLGAPVGDYFGDGDKALTLLIDDHNARCAPDFGSAKTGGNYAAALRHVLQAKEKHQADQVLFCPGGDVQETGASNFFLLDNNRILTKPLDGSFLPGITRDSILTLAAHLGYQVIEQDFTVQALKDWVAAGGEAALSGTAAVLAGVGHFVHGEQSYPASAGRVGPNTKRLREALVAIQTGDAEDRFSWLS